MSSGPFPRRLLLSRPGAGTASIGAWTACPRVHRKTRTACPRSYSNGWSDFAVQAGADGCGQLAGSVGLMQEMCGGLANPSLIQFIESGAAGIENLESGLLGVKFSSQLQAGHSFRHEEVSDEQIDFREMFFPQRQGDGSGRGLEDVIATTLQDDARQFAQDRFILSQQDRFTSGVEHCRRESAFGLDGHGCASIYPCTACSQLSTSKTGSGPQGTASVGRLSKHCRTALPSISGENGFCRIWPSGGSASLCSTSSRL